MNMVLVLGCLSLVLLKTLHWADLKSLRIKRCLVAWLTGLLAGAFVIYQTLAMLGYVHSASDTGYLKYNIQRIRENRDKLPANLILVEGGSYAARAIDYKRLEKLLSARNYDVMVIQFCKPGANYIERMYWLEQFTKFIGPDALERMNKKNVVFLREVHQGYDTFPLMQFTYNYYTNSVLAYLRPGNAWLALRVAWLVHGKSLDIGSPSHAILELAKHGLLNAFNIGAFHRFMPFKDVRPVEPVFDMDKKKNDFKYQGPSLNALLKTRAIARPDLGWKALVDAQLSATGLKFKPAYFAVPSLYADHMVYCENTTDRTPYLTFGHDHDFLVRFDNPQSWYDKGHMLRYGGELYTAWLADKIIAQGLLTPGRPGQHRDVLAVQAREDLAGTRSHREISKP